MSSHQGAALLPALRNHRDRKQEHCKVGAPYGHCAEAVSQLVPPQALALAGPDTSGLNHPSVSGALISVG